MLELTSEQIGILDRITKALGVAVFHSRCQIPNRNAIVIMKSDFYKRLIRERGTALELKYSTKSKRSTIAGAEIHICDDIDYDFIVAPFSINPNDKYPFEGEKQ